MNERTGAGPLEERMMAVHTVHTELFFEHQVALLDRDVARARSLFGTFAHGIRGHAQDEEEHVLPAYAAHGGDETDSPSTQFQTEHRKILAFVDDVEERLAVLDAPPDDRALLELLDRESWFKNLMAHHDMREGRVLYPKLSEWLSDGEQEAILARVSTRTDRLPVDDQGSA